MVNQIIQHKAIYYHETQRNPNTGPTGSILFLVILIYIFKPNGSKMLERESVTTQELSDHAAINKTKQLSRSIFVTEKTKPKKNTITRHLQGSEHVNCGRSLGSVLGKESL